MSRPVHQLLCGLTVYQSVLKHFKDGESVVIGGLLNAFESITKTFDRRDVIKHMIALCTELRDFKPRIDFFPSNNFSKIIADHANAEIPGIEIILNDDEVEEAEIVEIDSDNVDSDSSLSGMLERPASEDRGEEPSHISDAVHLCTD